MQHFSQAYKTKLLLTLSGVLAITAVFLMVFGKETGPATMITDHVAYFPQDANLYLELSPGEPWGKRFANYLQTHSHRPLTPQASSVDLSKIYDKDFLPEISLGCWGVKSLNDFASARPATRAKDTPKPFSFLMVLKTKPGLTTRQLIADLAIDPQKVKYAATSGIEMAKITLPPASIHHIPGPNEKHLQHLTAPSRVPTPVNTTEGTKTQDETTKQNFPAAEPQAPPKPRIIWLGIHQNHLLLAETQEELLQALANTKQKQTLLNNPLYNETLHLLPTVRQGTFLAHMTGIDWKDPKIQSSLDTHPSLKRYFEVNEQLAKAVPISVGSLVIEPGNELRFDLLTPFEFSKIQDESFRNDVQSFVSDTSLFDTPKHLPQSTLAFMGFTNLSKFFDIFIKHVATDAHKKGIEQIQTQANLFGLDFRKNILGCFDGKFGFTLLSQNGRPDMAVFIPANPDTQKTVDQLAALATSMAKATKEERQLAGGRFKITVVAPPKKESAKMAFASMFKDTLALGTPSALEQLVEVETQQSPSLMDNTTFRTLSDSFPSKVNWLMFINFKDMDRFKTKAVTKVNELTGNGANAMAQNSPAVREALKTTSASSGVEALSAAGYMDGNKIFRTQVHVKVTPSSLAQ